MLLLAVFLYAPFTCTTESGSFGDGSSSLQDCSSLYCEVDEEVCYDDSYCDTGDDSCSGLSYDNNCHVDCTESEHCEGGEDCTYVGSNTWLCI